MNRDKIIEFIVFAVGLIAGFILVFLIKDYL
jgi:hypothetical protein